MSTRPFSRNREIEIKCVFFPKFPDKYYVASTRQSSLIYVAVSSKFADNFYQPESSSDAQAIMVTVTAAADKPIKLLSIWKSVDLVYLVFISIYPSFLATKCVKIIA